jgi:hypothetical protein
MTGWWRRTVTAQVLLDASFWIALRDRASRWHSQARRAAEELLRLRTRLVFTSFILAETHAYFSRSPAMRNQILDDAQKKPGPALGAGLRKATKRRRWPCCASIATRSIPFAMRFLLSSCALGHFPGGDF